MTGVRGEHKTPGENRMSILHFDVTKNNSNFDSSIKAGLENKLYWIDKIFQKLTIIFIHRALEQKITSNHKILIKYI